MFKQQDMIDLSQILFSGKEVNFQFELALPDATEAMPMLSHDDGVWYKIGRVNMCTHNGTHVEVPYHHLKEGKDLVAFPLHKLAGNLTVVDFSYKKPGEMITLEEFRKYDSKIKNGDLVFMKTGLDRCFRSAKWLEFPYVQIEAIQWLIEKGIQCLGTDSAGIEDIYAHNQPGHVTLFQADIPLVESLTNLDAVKEGDFLVFVLPLPIADGDASPVRVVAIRKSAFQTIGEVRLIGEKSE